jgi:hypothetical protein
MTCIGGLRGEGTCRGSRLPAVTLCACAGVGPSTFAAEESTLPDQEGRRGASMISPDALHRATPTWRPAGRSLAAAPPALGGPPAVWRFGRSNAGSPASAAAASATESAEAGNDSSRVASLLGQRYEKRSRPIASSAIVSLRHKVSSNRWERWPHDLAEAVSTGRSGLGEAASCEMAVCPDLLHGMKQRFKPQTIPFASNKQSVSVSLQLELSMVFRKPWDP